MANGNDLAVLGIDLSASKQRMESQLKKVLSDISSGKSTGIIAGLNVAQSKSRIQEQLNTIAKGLKLDVNINTTHNNQLQQLEKQTQQFHKNTMNGIDFEIAKREDAARRYSSLLKSQMEQAVKAEKEIAASQKQSIVSDTLSVNAKKMQQELTNLKSSVAAVTKNPEFAAKWQELFDASKVVKTREELTNLNAKVGLFKKEIGAAGSSMAQGLAQATARMIAMMVIMKTIELVIGSIKRMVTEVTALDKSLTELQKVSDVSGKSLEEFTDKAFDAAEQLGSTGRAVVDAATEFKRAGYEIEDTLKMAEAAIVMENVGDGINNVKDASSALISVLRAFKIDETDIMTIVDKINEVSNNSPIDFNNITEGLRRVSGTLAQTGTDIDETIALITGGFSTLRDAPMVSSGLVMISQRLRGVDEDGQAIEGLMPKLQKDFKEMANIDIEDSNGNLRSTYDILADMAEVFPTLTSKQQQYLGELAAG